MCCDCGCGPRGRHYYEGCHEPFAGLPFLMSVEEEVKMLEELKESLEKRVEKVEKRLQALKR